MPAELLDWAYFECVADEHRKFYELWVEGRPGHGTFICARWGRIGTQGQSKELTKFFLVAQARSGFAGHMKERIKKGYVIVGSPAVDEMRRAREAMVRVVGESA